MLVQPRFPRHRAAALWVGRCFIVAALCGLGQATFAVPEPTVDDVLTAWRDRTSRIHSFAYDCEITATHFNVNRYDASDPFSGDRDGDLAGETIVDRLTLGETMSLRVSGKKIGSHVAGEQWDYQNEKRKYFELTFGYDSVCQRRLFQGEAIFGEIAKKDTPDESITNLGSQIAINLCYSPIEMLNRLAYMPAKMKIVDTHRQIAGHKCIELSVPRRSDRWTGTLAVDPNRDFLPVRFTTTLGRVVMSQRTIEYSVHPDLGWVVKSWVDKSFTEKGHPRSVESANVTHVTVNEPVDDHEFSIDFPVGTRLTVVDGKTHVLLANGKRRPYDNHGQDRWQNRDSKYVALDELLHNYAAATPVERQRVVGELREYVRDPASARVNVWFLLEIAARQIHAAAGPDAAIDFCRDFAIESDVCRQCLTKLSAEIAGKQRRQHLLGSKINLAGLTVDGLQFDASSLVGKILLVDFWFTGCGPCHRDLPWLKQLYQTHGPDDFEIVGISVDDDADDLKTYLQTEEIAWTIIHDSPRGASQGAASNAVDYNVQSFPTYFLVDRSGNVLYAGGHTAELDELLAKKLRSKL